MSLAVRARLSHTCLLLLFPFQSDHIAVYGNRNRGATIGRSIQTAAVLHAEFPAVAAALQPSGRHLSIRERPESMRTAVLVGGYSLRGTDDHNRHCRVLCTKRRV